MEILASKITRDARNYEKGFSFIVVIIARRIQLDVTNMIVTDLNDSVSYFHLNFKKIGETEFHSSELSPYLVLYFSYVVDTIPIYLLGYWNNNTACQN